jgi:hypothetical protein
LLFIQARPRKTADGRPTLPDEFLDTLPSSAKVEFDSATPLPGGLGEVAHGAHGPRGDVRVHRVPVALYRAAHKRAFFEPRPGTLRLFAKFNEPVKQLCAAWWERIETSEKFLDHRPAILAAARRLQPGDITLVGSIAEGGQGLATGNNARFLAYLEGSPQAGEILKRREVWTAGWLADPAIKPVFLNLLRANGGDVNKPTKNGAAWEACVEPLRAQFTAQQLGFKKSDLYRVALKALVADETDFAFTWQRRKQDLLALWRTDKGLAEFWTSTLGDGEKRKRAQKLHKAKEVSDADFCLLCGELQRWLPEENAARKGQKQPVIRWTALGLRSGEDYPDPADAPRVAVVYNGLAGHGQSLPFLKGDPEGNRWLENELLFIYWSKQDVDFLSSSLKARWQGQDFFLRAGISWTRGANHVPLKAKLIEPAIMDVNAMKLSPLPGCGVSANFLLAVFNSDVFSFFLKKFIAHTWMAQINDLRMMPLVMPTRAQESRLEKLAGLALAAKRHHFAGQSPSHELAAEVRALGEELFAQAPAYLRPDAQRKLLATAADCLVVLELAVNWETERLYGVEGSGPFDEF